MARWECPCVADAQGAGDSRCAERRLRDALQIGRSARHQARCRVASTWRAATTLPSPRSTGEGGPCRCDKRPSRPPRAGVFREVRPTRPRRMARKRRAARQARAVRGTHPGDEACELGGEIELAMGFEQRAERFSGTVMNTTNQTVRDLRVEIHLSNGVELGPTPRVDLSAGETRPVELDARGQTFDW